jgi:penicillin amidase
MKKTIGLIGLTLGAVAGVVGTGYYLLFRRPLPKKSGSVTLQGLGAPVKVVRDDWGIPHITAETIHDVMFAQGYVHAQDRLWQMEFNRRLVAGRLSEILGEVSLPLDRWMRIIGMRRVAEKEASLISSATQAILQAYADGVNARIGQGNLPVEFTLLRFRPEPWKVADSISWSKMMSWSLSVDWEAEIIRAQILAQAGPDVAAELDMLNCPDSPVIIPPDFDFSKIGNEALKRAEAARKFTGPAAQNGVGSNNWVIAGSHTNTGMPLLANDMHLGLSIPSIWYENHLQAEDLHISGISFPGIPGIIAGHNQNVAWGFTNGFPDVQDLYMEHLKRTQDGRVLVEFKGEWLEAQVIEEVISIKGRQPVTEEVVITHHGPIINKLAPDFSGEQPLALQWVSLEPSNMFDAILKMNKAQNCAQFLEALRTWDSPAQNMVFADTQGNIAYKLPGKIPIRAKGDGRLPVPGWTGEYEWSGAIPFEALPYLVNPPGGFIATANNRVVGQNYPFHLSHAYCKGDRAQRIIELIQEEEKLSIADIQKMQFDQISVTARKFALLVGQLEPKDPELQIVTARLRSWNGQLSPESPEASIYEVMCARLIQRLLKSKLGDLAEYYAGKGITPVLAEGSIMGERSREWLEQILDTPHSPWFNLGKDESREEVLALTLRETVDELKKTLGPGMEDWRWGKLHTLVFSHPLGAVKPLDRLFNRGPYPLGGDFDTVWATGSSRVDLTKSSIVGPPFRFIADLSNWENCLGLLTPGQSGQPSSPHYADNIQAWFTGEYHPMAFSPETVQKTAKDGLTLLAA